MTLVSMIGQKKKEDNLGYTWRFPTQGWHRTTFFSLFSCCQVFNIPQDIGTQFYNHMDSINFMSSFGGFLAPTKPPTRNLTAIRSWTVRRWKMMKTMLSDPGNLAYFQGRTVKLQGRREFFQSAPAKPSQEWLLKHISGLQILNSPFPTDIFLPDTSPFFFTRQDSKNEILRLSYHENSGDFSQFWRHKIVEIHLPWGSKDHYINDLSDKTIISS